MDGSAAACRARAGEFVCRQGIVDVARFKSYHVGDDVAGPLYKNSVADFDAEPAYFFFVVECGAADEYAAD